MNQHDDDVPVRFVMERVREVQDAVTEVGRKIDTTLGEYAVRLARLELRQDLTDRRLDNDTGGRRYLFTAVVSTVAVLVSVAGVVVTIVLKG